MKKIISLLSLSALLSLFLLTANAQGNSTKSDEGYLSWNAQQAMKIGESWRVKGRVGGYFDTRVFDTDKSYNYKLRATLMSPEVIRATARIEQLRSSLTNDETRNLVKEAEDEESLIVIVEIDPREGSGIIPNDWRALLEPKGVDQNANRKIRGATNNELRDIKALKGVVKRDYDYDIFWVEFPLKDEKGNSFWNTVPNEIELVVGIYNKEGRVTWKVSDALKTRIEKIIKKEEGN